MALGTRKAMLFVSTPKLRRGSPFPTNSVCHTLSLDSKYEEKDMRLKFAKKQGKVKNFHRQQKQ